MHTVYLSLGTNLGNKQSQLLAAIGMLREQAGRVERVSSFIETAPWGFESNHNFLNACVCLTTELQPLDLLRITQQIERSLGRREKSHDGIYHDRPIDIDILLFDDLTLSTPELTIPHPHMKEREFVMKPLKEIYL